MHLFVCTDDSHEAISFVEGIIESDVEFLNCMFEMCDFVV